MEEKQIIFSPSDCYQAVKRAKWLILTSALFFGVLFFCYFLLKPPTFTAEAVFKGGTQSNTSSFSKALEFIGHGESYSVSEDAKVFLKSYPVLENVVEDLHLQLHIQEKKHFLRIKQIWHTLKAQKARRLLGKKRPASSILKMSVPSKLIIPDKKVLLKCVHLDYSQEVSEVLQLRFLDDTSFELNGKQGRLGQLFHWERGSFQLEGLSSLAGKTFKLTFIPLREATLSLESKIRVKRSKNHTGLVHVAFTHQDRWLATSIVNQAMLCFQKYLKREGKRKISQQIDYLKHRQNEALRGLETIMSEQEAYLKSHLDAGEMLLLKNELQFIAQAQAELRRELDVVMHEMKMMFHLIQEGKEHTFEEIIAHLHAEKEEELPTLTLSMARALVLDYQKSVDQIHMQIEQFNDCLVKLLEPDFDPSSLSKVIDDPTLASRFEKMHTLHHNYVDEKNWSAKERAHLLQELETEKQFLMKHVADLKQGAELKNSVFQNRLKKLHRTLLFLLLDQYESIENALQELAFKSSKFPQKWLNEQKIELNTKLQTEIIESITKMIEVKNIDYHLDYLSSTPLFRAKPPVVPNSPKLVWSFLVGVGFGAFIVLLMLFIRECFLGPTASFSNLKSEGKTVLSFGFTLDDLNRVHYQLKNSGPIFSVLSKSEDFARDLSLLFRKEGKNVRFISDQSDFILQEEAKTYDAVIFHSSADLDSLEARRLIDLADQPVIMLNQERYHALPALPSHTLYLAQKINYKAFKLSQILPFLEGVLSGSVQSGGMSQENQRT